MDTLYKWSCSNNDFHEEVTGIGISAIPKRGVYKSVMENRWCHSCQTIRHCFIGVGKKYDFGDLEGQARSRFYSGEWDWSKMLDMDWDAIISEAQRLELDQKKSIFFRFTKNMKKLVLIKDSIALCRKLTKEGILFYQTRKPKARCISCGSNNVSQVNWRLDRHACGGTFNLERINKKKEGLSSRIDYVRFDYMLYDETGIFNKVYLSHDEIRALEEENWSSLTHSPKDRE
jgi:hypothetical protein